MWKVLVWVQFIGMGSGGGHQVRAQVFEFNTEQAADQAASFFSKYDCRAIVVRDEIPPELAA